MWKEGQQFDEEWLEIECRAQEKRDAAYPYIEIVIAILKQAREDYRLKPRKRKEIVAFIQSDWFEELTLCIIDNIEEARDTFIHLLEQDVRNRRKAV
jgi:hypothetical protein